MKVIVATEDTGGLEDISFYIGTNTSVKGSVKPNITPFATAGRSAYVQRMVVVRLREKEYICIARKGGQVQLYDVQPPYSLFMEWRDVSHQPNDAFVGLEYVEGKLSSCTSRGKLVMRDLQSNKIALDYHTRLGDRLDSYRLDVRRANSAQTLGESVNAYRVHPKRPDIIAFGGKEQELEINLIENIQPTQSVPSEADEEGAANNIPTQSIDDDRTERKWVLTPSPRNGSTLIRRKLWRAKNVRNDSLDLRVPVWVSDIRFLDIDRVGDARSEYDFRVAITTRFGHVRLYETRISRKPIMNVEVGEHPLTALVPSGLSADEVVICDTHSTIAEFDLVGGRIGGHFKSGSTGAVLCMDTLVPDESIVNAVKQEEKEEGNEESGDDIMPQQRAEDKPLLATGGLDRYLHVYDVGTRQLVGRIYVGAKLSAVCIVDGRREAPTEENVSEREESESESESAEEGNDKMSSRKKSRKVKVKKEEDEDAEGPNGGWRKRKEGDNDDDEGEASESSSQRGGRGKRVRFAGRREGDKDEEEDADADADSVWQMLEEDDSSSSK
ncbi:uncharacterized protein V1516DRAFT_676403 [Lipomyces oligophaga]|uniref:uncharacterized protein n=1 Tax=Lipomyces oligophaga TaxID=45792 RepID=UPI0034CEE9A5